MIQWLEISLCLFIKRTWLCYRYFFAFASRKVTRKIFSVMRRSWNCIFIEKHPTYIGTTKNRTHQKHHCKNRVERAPSGPHITERRERESGGMYPQHGADTKESHKGFAHCAACRRQKLSGFVAPLPPRPTKAKRW